MQPYQYWLLSNPLLTTIQKRKLYDYFFDAYHVFYASKDELIDSQIINENLLDEFLRQREKTDINKEYDKFLDSPFSFVTIEDDNFPQKLRLIHEKPYGLFYIGKLPNKNQKCISMVGARNCSVYGKKMALELGEALGANGFVVVSGLAKGVDTFSHIGALNAKGMTVAVLGCGIDVIYPQENARLYENIVEGGGCIVSEYVMGTAPRKELFPQRNRIISGLCDTTIVVEARLKSGSLITADFALEQGRDIYVVPGRIGDALSAGCNRLIDQGAGIITSVNQFITDITEIDNENKIILNSLNTPMQELSETEIRVLGVLDLYPKSFSTILNECSMDYLKLLTTLSDLASKGLIKEIFKNQYIVSP